MIARLLVVGVFHKSTRQQTVDGGNAHIPLGSIHELPLQPTAPEMCQRFLQKWGWFSRETRLTEAANSSRKKSVRRRDCGFQSHSSGGGAAHTGRSFELRASPLRYER